MNRHEARQIDRDLGVKSTKMKRQRPPSREVQAAIRERVAERVAEADPAKDIIVAPPPVWVVDTPVRAKRQWRVTVSKGAAKIAVGTFLTKGGARRAARRHISLLTGRKA